VGLSNYFIEKTNFAGEEIVCKDDFQKLIKKFRLPEMDPITKLKIWIWRYKFLNNLFFISKFYAITRVVGIGFRKNVRKILKMENIDDWK
jgi:hypothetical protein